MNHSKIPTPTKRLPVTTTTKPTPDQTKTSTASSNRNTSLKPLNFSMTSQVQEASRCEVHGPRYARMQAAYKGDKSSYGSWCTNLIALKIQQRFLQDTAPPTKSKSTRGRAATRESGTLTEMAMEEELKKEIKELDDYVEAAYEEMCAMMGQIEHVKAYCHGLCSGRVDKRGVRKVVKVEVVEEKEEQEGEKEEE